MVSIANRRVRYGGILAAEGKSCEIQYLRVEHRTDPRKNQESNGNFRGDAAKTSRIIAKLLSVDIFFS